MSPGAGEGRASRAAARVSGFLGSLFGGFRGFGVFSVAVAGAVFFARFVHGFEPIRQWLFWRYSGAALGAAFWALACLCVGHRLLRRVIGLPLGFADELALAFPLGMTVFGVGMFLLGLAGALGWFTLVAWPLVLIFAGRASFFSTVRRFVRHHRSRSRDRGVPAGWVPLSLAGALGLLFLYYPLLSPATFNHDTRWYHMAMAEHYVREGGMGAAPSERRREARERVGPSAPCPAV
jgi:hypothetical protein